MKIKTLPLKGFEPTCSIHNALLSSTEAWTFLFRQWYLLIWFEDKNFEVLYLGAERSLAAKNFFSYDNLGVTYHRAKFHFETPRSPEDSQHFLFLLSVPTQWIWIWILAGESAIFKKISLFFFTILIKFKNNFNKRICKMNLFEVFKQFVGIYNFVQVNT